MSESAESSAFSKQEGGSHYKHFVIQPAEFCQKNRLGWCESNVIKYVCRHGFKGRDADIRKAIHYLEMLLETEYPVTDDNRGNQCTEGLSGKPGC